MARPRSEQARRKMLDGATELALEVGVRGFTIDEVARRTGVAKTTIYRHFASKNALLVAALDGITPVPRVPDTGSLHDDLVAFITDVLPAFASRRLRALFLDVAAVASFDPELDELQAAMLGGRAHTLSTIITNARQRGELPSDLDIATAFEVVEGPLVMRSIADPGQLDDLDIGDYVTRIIARLNA